MKTLHLNLKAEYFDDIESENKDEEYRLYTPYWTKRLVGREYDAIVLKRGYPRKDDRASHLIKPYKGYTVKTITHPHFGDKPVEVFAIDVGVSI